MSETNDNVSSELNDKLLTFHNSLENTEKALRPILCGPVSDLTKKMEPLDKATVDLVSAYALDSLFWMYLITKGEETQEHDIKHELGRVREYMLRVREIKDRAKAPKLDAAAAKRFVRSSLWTPKNKRKNVNDDATPADEDQAASTPRKTSRKGKSRKRKN